MPRAGEPVARSAHEAQRPQRSDTRSRPGCDSIRGKARAWLRVAALIATRHVNGSDLRADLDVGRNTMTRYIGDLEHVYGFVVVYVQPDGRFPGWYEIVIWGVIGRGCGYRGI